MRGHIKKRGEKSWTLVVYLGRDPQTQKKKYRWQSVKGTKKQAEKELTALLTSIEEGNYVKPTRMTVAECLEEWLRNYVAINTTQRTQHRYTEIVRIHLIPALGSIPLKKLQPRQIQSYYTEALTSGHRKREGGLSPKTVQYHHRVLYSALKYAVKQGMLVRNSAEAVDAPRGTSKELTILGPEDICKFFDMAKSSPYYPIFFTAAYTGMRRSELLGLRWCDVELDAIEPSLSVTQTLHQLANGEYVIKEPKSKAGRRRIALFPSTTILLKEHKTKNQSIRILNGNLLRTADLVFSHPDGSPIRPNSVTRAFKTLAKSIEPEGATLHDLRHFHATMLLKQGIHPKIVSERLGHSKVAFTLDRYSHVLPGLQEAAGMAFEEGMRLAAEKIHSEMPRLVKT